MQGERAREIVVGIVASPGPATEMAERLVPELADAIGARFPGVTWQVRLVSDRLVQPPTDLSALVDAGRRRLLEEGWDLAICLTDLPLETARRPVVAHASATHGVAVLSLPALGAVGVQRRASAGAVRLVAALLGDDAQGGARRRSAVLRRMHELGGRVDRGEHGFAMINRVVGGNVRLLLGMLRTNRPWRVALRMWRALVAALAVGVFALVTSDVWRLADALGPLRLSLVAVVALLAMTVTIVVAAGLWERSPGAGAREQVVLFNLVTVATVAIGVLTLYAALFVMMLTGTLLVVPRHLLADILGHRATGASVAALAWLATSMAVAGGALGAALETDEDVREAAYAYQPDVLATSQD